MKNLTDDELFELVEEKIGVMEKHLFINKLLIVVLLVEALFLLTNTISMVSYLLFVVPCWGVYLFHYFKYKKALKSVEKILDEFNKREIL